MLFIKCFLVPTCGKRPQGLFQEEPAMRRSQRVETSLSKGKKHGFPLQRCWSTPREDPKPTPKKELFRVSSLGWWKKNFLPTLSRCSSPRGIQQWHFSNSNHVKPQEEPSPPLLDFIYHETGAVRTTINQNKSDFEGSCSFSALVGAIIGRSPRAHPTSNTVSHWPTWE